MLLVKTPVDAADRPAIAGKLRAIRELGAKDVFFLTPPQGKGVVRVETVTGAVSGTALLLGGLSFAVGRGIRRDKKLPVEIGGSDAPCTVQINPLAGHGAADLPLPLWMGSRPCLSEAETAPMVCLPGLVCVLRSGREAYRSAAAITAALRRGLERTGLTPDLVNLVEDTSHAGAAALMTATGYIDLLIPRGGAGLIRACVEHATVPCIQTGTGICHIYVDESADLDMALDIIENAKTSRPSVCNAAEVLLVHRAAAPRFLPMLQKRLCGPGAKHPVRLRCDGEAAAILGIAPDAEFDTEFLDYVLAVGVVDGVEGAIRHIAQHSTHHSEAIVTQSEENAARFTAGVDSAAVYVNASTRFTDGGEFGLGCEMGISTQKLHARGPIGLNELTTYQYVITGNGQIRR